MFVRESRRQVSHKKESSRRVFHTSSVPCCAPWKRCVSVGAPADGRRAATAHMPGGTVGGTQGRDPGSRRLAASCCNGPGAWASGEGLVLALAAVLAQSARLPSACGNSWAHISDHPCSR